MRNTINTLVLCLMANLGHADDNLVVPREAFDLAKSHGCEQVADFFNNRPGVEDPPYALIAGDSAKFQIAVWCTPDRSVPDPQRSYTLLLRLDDTANPLARCPAEIRGIKHIGGLRFVDISDEAKSYYFVDSRKPVPLKGTLRTKGVLSSYDGVGEKYVCIDGRWAFQTLD